MNNIQILDTQIEAPEKTQFKEYSLRDVLNFYGSHKIRGSFPGCSAVLGLCMDGLPFVIDLHNPKPGNVLIASDELGSTALLKTACLSICALNSKQDVGFHIISTNPNKFKSVYQSHVLGIHSPFDSETGKLIIELGSQVEQRRTSRELGLVKVLIIDDLNSLRTMLSNYSVELNFQSLIKKGSRSKIWLMVSINRLHVKAEDEQLFRSFDLIIDQDPGYTHPPSVFTTYVSNRSFQIVSLS